MIDSYVLPPLTTSASRARPRLAGSQRDAIVLAHTVDVDAGRLHSVVDVGCGSGIVGILLAIQRPDLKVLAADVEYGQCAATLANARARHLRGRVMPWCVDALAVPWKRDQVLVCNPPLLPGETGWMFADGNPTAPFWSRLIRHVGRNTAAARMYLHLFECHGITERTGAFPSLLEVAHEWGFTVRCVYRGSRDVAADSQIRIRLPDLARVFPDGMLLCGDEPVALRSIVASARRRHGGLKAPHVVVRLVRTETANA
jgi:hypothetical protein